MADPETEQAASLSAFARIGVVLLGVTVLGAVAFVLVGGRKQPVVKPVADANDSSETQETYQPPSHEGYLGSEACAKCHEELFAAYSQHPMYYGATRRVEDDADPPASTETTITGNQRSLRADVNGTQIIHHELMHDANGKEIYDDSFKMDYVVGSGRRAKAYVFQRRNVFCISPLNWFGKSQTWGLNPGYTPDDPRRFDRRAVAICLVCHTGSLVAQKHGSNLFEEEPFRENAIGCERCHGPGEKHVSYHEEATKGIDPIVNPAKLDRRERESVCYQCHLQPSVTRILRPGRSDLDFRPGQKLEDIWTVLETRHTVDAEGRTKSVRQVQQMRESECFKQSDTLSCTSCHDPHRVPNVTERVAFFRNRCLKCHGDDSECSAQADEREAVGDSCIKCHMPKRDIVLASHVSQTDHRVLRTPQQQRETAHAHDSQVRFFDDHDKRLSETERRRVIALALVRRGGPYSELLAEELGELSKQFPQDGEVLLAHGSVARAKGDYEAATAAFKLATQVPASQETALEVLTQMTYLAQDMSETLIHSEALIRINPYVAQVYVLRADALLTEGRPEEAIESALRALELNPSLTEARRWLAITYGKLGRVKDQQEQEALVERMLDAKAINPK